MGSFLPSWIRIRIRNLCADPDPDPTAQINADPCGSGSGYGSGSETLLKILAISVANRKIDQFNISDHLKPPPPSRQELIFCNPTNNSHGPLGVQYRKNCMKLKMFLMLLGTTRGAVQSLLHFGLKKSIYIPPGKCVKRAKKSHF